jgi:hypothetical protein
VNELVIVIGLNAAPKNIQEYGIRIVTVTG